LINFQSSEELVCKDECCIHHSKSVLEKYGILTLKKDTYDVKIMLEQNKFSALRGKWRLPAPERSGAALVRYKI
jgi:hypothetical protein